MPGDPPQREAARYCDVAVPVPLDRLYTYSVPAHLAGMTAAGSRVAVPFGSRTLHGVVMSVHGQRPEFRTKPVRKLLGEVPALSAELLDLGRWIARYYCAPLGEVLRTMLPPSIDIRTKKVVSITAAGDDRLARADLPSGVDLSVLESLRRRPLTLPYLSKKHPGAQRAIRRMQRRGWVEVETVLSERDPTAARSARLLVEAGEPGAVPARSTAAERWLLRFLARNPGQHDLRALGVQRKDAVPTARRLARSGAVRLEVARPQRKGTSPSAAFRLHAAQQAALDAIAAAVARQEFEVFLLHGVTGSGKTEVYLRAMEQVLAQGRSALLMVPEIALTPALASHFFARFGDRTAVLHSALIPSQRADQWRRIRSGSARVALGTRSAVFAPLKNLGLVVVDEEHDGSYKHGDVPRYHARDVAIVRARSAGATVVLGSATPALESRHNSEIGKSTLLTMPTRIFERPLPAVEKVDMRREFTETGRSQLFSRALVSAVTRCLGRGEQAVILLNRRGYSTYVLCRSCGERIECVNCAVTLTYHRDQRCLMCHYCDHARPVPKRCEGCGGPYLHFHGSGSERVEEELRRYFPDAKIARLDRDTVRHRNTFETVLGSFRDGECNLLVGTQMIAKGHDIPNVTLVCVVDSDVGLGRPDFRAAERTFQLLTQVAGRAGRGEKPGRVLIQTMNPHHYAVDLASGQDYNAFYQRELRFRKALWYPPYSSVATIVVRAGKMADAEALSKALSGHLRPTPEGTRLMGPASAPVSKLRAEYRYQFLVKSLKRSLVARILGRARRFAEAHEWPATAMVIDVDPLELM